MIKRQVISKILKLIKQYPVVVITGPRQSGKTTLVENEFSEYQYFSLEDKDVREIAELDPRTFLAQNDGKLILDEVQKSPDLISYIQGIVDKKKEMGQFILSGSQNFQLMEQVTQSLAGRAALFTLLPLDFTELNDSNYILSDPFDQAIKGFYPAIYNRNMDHTIYYKNYLETHILRDVRSLINVQDIHQFRKFLQTCAHRAGQLINYADISKVCGISHTTVTRWMSLLETMYIIFQLQPFYENFDKRIVKSPKLYFYDTGLLSYLLGFKDSKQLQMHQSKGAIFENMIIAEFIKQNHHQYLDDAFYFFRDSNQNEIDLVIPEHLKFHLIEIKASRSFNSKFLTPIQKLANIVPDKVLSKQLIYAGDKNIKTKEFDIKSWQTGTYK